MGNVILMCVDGKQSIPSFSLQVIPGALARLQKGEKLIHPSSRNGEEMLVDLEGFVEYREVSTLHFSSMIAS